MIKGSLDYVDEKRVAGWVYCGELSMKDRPILAFVRGACVGSGSVSIHRPDLEAVGLGDGFAGFGFHITLPSSAAPTDVYVKLEAADMILPQKAWLRG